MQKAVALFFGLFWTAIVLVFDGIAGFSAVNQIRACSFASVTGVITHSEITTHSDSDGSTSGVDIRYHYEIDGKSFEGDRFRYGAGSSSDSGWARVAVAKYSVGSEMPVFYNPKDPAESLLAPGLDGSNFMWLIFLTPFNAVMLGLWIGAGIFLRDKFFKSQNGGVKVIEDGPLTRIRLPHYPACVLGIATTGVIGFIEMFVLAFTGGFHPKTGLAATAFFIAYGAGIVMILWQWRKAHSGMNDLTIDARDGSIEFPLTHGRKVRQRFSASDIGGVAIDEMVQTDSERGAVYRYVPTIIVRNQKPADGKLGEWLSKAKAERFADWLRLRLKIPLQNGQDSTAKPAAEKQPRR